MSFEPIPVVPPPALDQGKDLDPTVRSIAFLMMAFGAMVVLREVLYTVGSIQAYGAINAVNIRGWFGTLFSGGLAFAAAYGLRRLESWAYWLTVIGGTIWELRMGYEMVHMIRMSMTADGDKAGVQLVLFGAMMWILFAAVLLLLTPKGRAPFNK
jgi:hypothetical protein